MRVLPTVYTSQVRLLALFFFPLYSVARFAAVLLACWYLSKDG